MWSMNNVKNEVLGTLMIKKKSLINQVKDLFVFGIVFNLALHFLWGLKDAAVDSRML